MKYYRVILNLAGDFTYVDADYYLVIDNVLYFYLDTQQFPIRSFNATQWIEVREIVRT